MNTYSKKSRRLIAQTTEDLQVVFTVVLQKWDHTILTGHRTEDNQNKAHASGQSKVQWPNSKHNSYPSDAIDVSPYPVPKNWGEGDRNEYEKFRYFAFYVIGVADALYEAGRIARRLRWGGDWDMDNDVNDQSFNDLVHFEMYGERQVTTC